MNDMRVLSLRRLFGIGRENGLDKDGIAGVAAAAGFGEHLSLLTPAQIDIVAASISKKSLRRYTTNDIDFLPFRSPPTEEKKALMAKASKLLYAMRKSWAYADEIGRRMTGKSVVDWLTPTELHHVVAELSRARGRQSPPQTKQGQR